MYFQEEVRSYRLIWLTLENSEHASYDQKLFITMFLLNEQAEYKSEFAGTKSTLVYARNKSASRTEKCKWEVVVALRKTNISSYSSTMAMPHVSMLVI